jgi:NADH:ubiquinone oxidoreductase subunit 5 (subunit L)/multisubunit Na+/H+ antiporter MnhA subunit
VVGLKLSATGLVFVFLISLVVIAFVVVCFGGFYLARDTYYLYYLLSLALFVISILAFAVAGCPVSALICWDLLGVSSFVLVVFYWSSDSIVGALSTLFTGRLGDLGLLLLVSSVLVFGTSGALLFSLGLVFQLWVVLASFTKGAQFPFLGWLPRAMSAPTPVRALVHSSTLVTAGLFLMYFSLSCSGFGSVVAWALSSLTLCLSGVIALVEEDFKKVVALSTLSQVAFCFLGLLSGGVLSSFAHLLGHAFIKSALFLGVGYIIYVSAGQQDVRIALRPVPGFFRVVLAWGLLSLCGLLYRRASSSKEWVLYHVGGFCGYASWGLSLFVFLTFLYSWRLWTGGRYLLYSGLSFRLFTLGLIWSSPLLLLSLYFAAWLSGSFILGAPQFVGASGLYASLSLVLFSLLGTKSRNSCLLYRTGALGPYFLGFVAHRVPHNVLFEAFVGKVFLDAMGVLYTLRSRILWLRSGVSSPMWIWVALVLVLI